MGGKVGKRYALRIRKIYINYNQDVMIFRRKRCEEKGEKITRKCVEAARKRVEGIGERENVDAMRRSEEGSGSIC